MTRHKQIEDASQEYLKKPHSGFGAKFDFASGAEWADSTNPYMKLCEEMASADRSR